MTGSAHNQCALLHGDTGCHAGHAVRLGAHLHRFVTGVVALEQVADVHVIGPGAADGDVGKGHLVAEVDVDRGEHLAGRGRGDAGDRDGPGGLLVPAGPEGVGARRDLTFIAREDTGVSWYPKASPPDVLDSGGQSSVGAARRSDLGR